MSKTGKYLFWLVALLALGGIISFISQSQQGYVFFRLGNTTVETSLWFLIGAVVASIIVVWFSIRFFRILFGYPGQVMRKIGDITHSNKKRSAERMLLAHMSGDYKTSEKYAARFDDKQFSSELGYMVRIDALIRQGKLGQAAPLIRRNLKTADKHSLPMFRCLQMQLFLAQRKNKKVIDIYKSLPKKLRTTMRWQDIYWQALLGLSEIRTLISSLPSPYSYNDDNRKRISEHYRKALQQLLNHNSDEAREQIGWLWQQLPINMQNQRFYAESYIRTLLEQGDSSAVEKQLCKCASVPELGPVMQYWGDFVAPNVRNSLKQLEKLYQKNTDQWLGLGLGRVCLQLQLWGKAESYLHNTLDTHTDPEVNTIILITLAKLYYRQGNNDRAGQCLNKLETIHTTASSTPAE